MTPSLLEMGNTRIEHTGDYSNFDQCQSTMFYDQWDGSDGAGSSSYNHSPQYHPQVLTQSDVEVGMYPNASRASPSSEFMVHGAEMTSQSRNNDVPMTQCHPSEYQPLNSGYDCRGYSEDNQGYSDATSCNFVSNGQGSRLFEPIYPSHSALAPENEHYSEANGFSLLQRYAFTNTGFEMASGGCENFHNRVRTNLRKRERNMSINKAFDDLKGKIPNLPADTKVSKIKVLRLAAEYIKHLNSVLEDDDSQKESSSDKFEALSPDFVKDKFEEDEIERNAKRPRDEFKIDPDFVAIKRRKTDWSRIQEEINRHKEINKMRRAEKETRFANQNFTSFEYCQSHVNDQEQYHSWQTHQTDSARADFIPLDGDDASEFSPTNLGRASLDFTM